VSLGHQDAADERGHLRLIFDKQDAHGAIVPPGWRAREGAIGLCWGLLIPGTSERSGASPTLRDIGNPLAPELFEMIHRVGLLIASLAAAGTLVVALTLAGFAPGAAPVSGTVAAPTEVPPTASVQAAPPVQVDTVYLAAPREPATVTVHRVVQPPASGDDDEGESEGGDD
jgi:hypothetical protein